MYFGQLTEKGLIFSVFTNLIWTMTETLTIKKKKTGTNYTEITVLFEYVSFSFFLKWERNPEISPHHINCWIFF